MLALCARIEQTIVVAHEQAALYLLQGVDYNTDENQQRGTSEELCERVLHVQEACECRHDSDEGNEQRAWQRDA